MTLENSLLIWPTVARRRHLLSVFATMMSCPVYVFTRGTGETEKMIGFSGYAFFTNSQTLLRLARLSLKLARWNSRCSAKGDFLPALIPQA
jgi:hypothetical protein